MVLEVFSGVLGVLLRALEVLLGVVVKLLGVLEEF